MITTSFSAFPFLLARTTVADQMMRMSSSTRRKFKIGFLSNNPPMYHLIPKAKDPIEKMQQGGRYPRPPYFGRLVAPVDRRAAWKGHPFVRFAEVGIDAGVSTVVLYGDDDTAAESGHNRDGETETAWT